MTKLYLIRHGEAEGNLYRRIHGQYDSLITENGYRQIAALQERFRDIPLDAAYSSDLFRTMETAGPICRDKGLRLLPKQELRELHMGHWEDRTWGEVARTEPENMARFNQSSSHWKVEGGETLLELQERVPPALLAIAARHPGQSVAVFCHGMAIRMSCGYFLGLDPEGCRDLGHSDNTAVTLLEIKDGNVNIAFRDDNSHLSAEISTLGQQSWWKNKEGTAPYENLWYQPMDIQDPHYQELYVSSRREGWMDLGRDMHLFEQQPYLEQAKLSAQKGEDYLLCVKRRESIVGILEMDPERDANEGAGYISFLYMMPEARGGGLGVQLLGQAISTYRPMGRKTLRLSCGEDNPHALTFYQHHGFVKIGQREEPFGTVQLLEKNISKP